jgi:hypothetical protein
MKVAASVATVFVCAFSLDAQITPTLNQLPDGSSEIRIRNNSTVNLDAFATSVNCVLHSSAGPDSPNPVIVYVDPIIDVFPAIGLGPQGRTVIGPLPPNQERTVAQAGLAGKTFRGMFNIRLCEDRIAAAGILADGTTTGDAALLTGLMLRRSNMLLAVETAIEKLSDAGRQGTLRKQLLDEFKSMADSASSRWYLPAEQQIGLRVYQSIIGKLVNLPEIRDGSPDPLATFVAEETATLRERRIALSESQPRLADASLAGR